MGPVSEMIYKKQNQGELRKHDYHCIDGIETDIACWRKETHLPGNNEVARGFYISHAPSQYWCDIGTSKKGILLAISRHPSETLCLLFISKTQCRFLKAKHILYEANSTKTVWKSNFVSFQDEAPLPRSLVTQHRLHSNRFWRCVKQRRQK